MDQLKATVAAALRKNFSPHPFSVENLTVIHQGRFANAIVFRYRDNDYDLVIKDYSHCPTIVRKTVGRLFIAHEAKILKRLQGIQGVAPQGYKLSELMLAYPYIEGSSLSVLRRRGKRLPPAFFRELESTVRQMHHRGVVHLDMRNLGNILCGQDGRPYLIDFQSALGFARLPRWLQPLLRATDLSGVYKGWLALCDAPLAPRKRRFFDSFNRIRKLWVFRGYPLIRSRRNEEGAVFSDIPAFNKDARMTLLDKPDVGAIAKAFLKFLLVASFTLLAPAALYADAVLIGGGVGESSVTELLQEALLFLSAAGFFLLARYNHNVRGFAILVGGFFGVMLIRELDGLFDTIVHGFWVYPALVWTGFMLTLAARFRQGLAAAMAAATRSQSFVYITVGLVIVLAFSRIFGTGSLWAAVLDGAVVATVVKNSVQEGLELLGYLLVFSGTVGYCREVGLRQVVASEPRLAVGYAAYCLIRSPAAQHETLPASLRLPVEWRGDRAA